MRTQDCGGARRGDGLIQRRFHRGGLVCSRNHADHGFAVHQRGICQCDGLGGHGSKVRKAAIVDLLPAALVVELHHSDGPLISEIGRGRIAERDVTVFPDSHAGQINGGLRE